MKLKKGDKVVVLQGKDRGKDGEITRVFPKHDKVVVDGGAHPIGLVKKSQRPTRATMQGGIIDKFMPIPASAVAVICPAEHKPTRIGYRIDDTGAKVRVCRKCGAEL
jgi:large subunit ribosomal protein L24